MLDGQVMMTPCEIIPSIPCHELRFSFGGMPPFHALNLRADTPTYMFSLQIKLLTNHQLEILKATQLSNVF